MCQHILSCRNIRQKNSVQVHIDDLQPLLIGHFLSRNIDTDTRIVVTEIKSAELFYDLRYHRINLLRHRAVRLDRNYLTPGLISQLLRGLYRLCIVQIHDRHIRASLRKRRSRTLPDAACTACHKTFFPVQTHFFNNSHSKTSCF